MVVEMEVQAVPLQILEAKLTSIPLPEIVDKFEGVMKSNKYARVVCYPSINKATIWTANPVSSREAAMANGAVDSESYMSFRSDEEKKMLNENLMLCGLGQYEKADDVLQRVLESQLSRLNHYVGQYNHVLCLERKYGIPHADIEFNFDFAKNKEVLSTVLKYCDGNRLPYYNFEIRTTRQDDAILSCCQGRDAMWIDFQAKADVSKEFFDSVENIFRPIGFRKHWAKGMDNTDPAYVATQFPRVGEFIKLMKSFDPEGKFRNTQAESWFSVMDSLSLKLEEGTTSSAESVGISEEKKEEVQSRMGDEV